jgi:acetyl esterase/lipase
LAESPVPVKDFARRPDIISAKISPTGDYLAMSTWAGEQFGIAVIDLRNMKISGVMAFVHGDLPLGYAWVAPRRLVAEIGSTDGPLDQPRWLGELFAMNADGSGKEYLFGYRSKDQSERAWAALLDPLPEDPLHALITVRTWKQRRDFFDTLPFVDRINVLDGKREHIGAVPLYLPQILVDADGEPRFVSGYSHEGECCEFRTRAAGAKKWVKVDFPGGNPANVELHALDAERTSVYLSSSDGKGPKCVRQYRLDTKSLTTISCDPTVDPQVGISLKDKRPVAVRYEDGLPRTAYPDPEHPDARLLRSLEKSFPGQRISGASSTLDGSKMVILVDSDRSPGDYYLVNRTTKKVDYLLGRNRWINPETMQPAEPIRLETRDGLTVHGYITAKDGLKTRKSPTVVMPHGGPHGIRDYWEWNPDAQLLASRGYTVLQVNYRGSGGYGKAFEAAGHRKWGTAMQDDLTDAVKWAIARGIADPARICIYGTSYGGYAALMSAAREPDLYRCAAGLAGVYDLVEQVEDTDSGESQLGRKELRRILGNDEDALREQSPVTHVGELKAAVLIAHGTQDHRVPFSQAEALRKALDKAGKSYEWLEYSGEEHGLYKEENREDFYNRLLAFLDKHIGEKSGASPPK